MRDLQHTEIDGHKYGCTMMPIRKANQTFLELCAVLGQPVVKTLASASTDQDQDAANLLTAGLSMMLMNIDSDIADRLIANTFDGIIADGVGPLEAWNDDFDKHFRGRLFSMYKVWAWAIEVNYKDFLDAAQILGVTKGIKLGVKQFLNPPTPTSQSGPSSPGNTTEHH